ncbi:MAG: CPBP family intramembrane glutamic endopeptidase [Pirellulales bacterium]
MTKNASPSDGFAMAVMVEGGLAMVAVMLAWLFRVPVTNKIAPWGPPLAWAVARGLAVTLPMLGIFWWLMRWDRPTLRRLREQVQWLVGEMFPNASIGQFALVALLAGVGEELLFRGVIQTLLVDWSTPVVGLAVTSLLFGAAHALSKLYFLLATLIGICFGWLVLYYDDLVAPMVAHSVYDFVALVYLARARRTRRHT